MKKIILLCLGALCFISGYTQTPTGVKTRFPAEWLQYRDTASATAADTLCWFIQPTTAKVYYHGRPGTYWLEFGTFTPGSGFALTNLSNVNTNATLSIPSGSITAGGVTVTGVATAAGISSGMITSTRALFGNLTPPVGFQGVQWMSSQNGNGLLYNAGNGDEVAYGMYNFLSLVPGREADKMAVLAAHRGRRSPFNGSYFIEFHTTKFTNSTPNDYTFFKYMPGDGAVFFAPGHNSSDTLDFPGDTTIKVNGKFITTGTDNYSVNIGSSFTARSKVDKRYVDSSISTLTGPFSGTSSITTTTPGATLTLGGQITGTDMALSGNATSQTLSVTKSVNVQTNSADWAVFVVNQKSGGTAVAGTSATGIGGDFVSASPYGTGIMGAIRLRNQSVGGISLLNTAAIGGATTSVLLENGNFSTTGSVNADNITATGSVSAGNLSGTTYTPTITNGANVTSSSTGIAHFTRNGTQVSVDGFVTVTATSGASTTTTVGISLPIPSNFTSFADCIGNGSPAQVTGSNCIIAGNTTSDFAALSFLSLSVGGSTDIYFHFTYTIK